MYHLLKPLDDEEEEEADPQEDLNPQLESILKKINLTHEISSDHNQSALHLLEKLLKNQSSLRRKNEKLVASPQPKIKPKDLLGAESSIDSRLTFDQICMTSR